jgi:hypothetical protein
LKNTYLLTQDDIKSDPLIIRFSGSLKKPLPL